MSSTPPPYPPAGSEPAGQFPDPQEFKGFFGSLFDFSFRNLVTPKIVKLVYVIGTLAIAIGCLGFIVVGFSRGFLPGLLALIFVPIVAIIYLALFRMSLEVYYAVIRMANDIQTIKDRGH